MKVSMLVCATLAALFSGCSDDQAGGVGGAGGGTNATEDAFVGWEGPWHSQGRFLADPEMQPAYEAIAAAYNETYAEESGTTHTVDTVRDHWVKLYSTDFASADIAGSTVRFTDASGAELAACGYAARGCNEVFYSGPDNAWSLEPSEDAWSETWCTFEATTACGPYSRVIMTEFHSHDGEAPHGHLRYGDLSFEELWDDRYEGNGRVHHYWWPTLLGSSTTAAIYAAAEEANAVENAEYLTY